MALFDGQEKKINPGDYFAYATRSGNSGAMNVGLVLEVGDEKVKALTVSDPSSKRSPKVNDRPVWLHTRNMITIPRESIIPEIARALESAAADQPGHKESWNERVNRDYDSSKDDDTSW